MKHLKNFYESADESKSLIKDLYNNDFKVFVGEDLDYKIKYDISQIEIEKEFDVNDNIIQITITFIPDINKNIILAKYEIYGEIATGYTPASYDSPAEWDSEEYFNEGEKEFTSVEDIENWVENIELDTITSLKNKYSEPDEYF